VPVHAQHRWDCLGLRLLAKTAFALVDFDCESKGDTSQLGPLTTLFLFRGAFDSGPFCTGGPNGTWGASKRLGVPLYSPVSPIRERRPVLAFLAVPVCPRLTKL